MKSNFRKLIISLFLLTPIFFVFKSGIIRILPSDARVKEPSDNFRTGYLGDTSAESRIRTSNLAVSAPRAGGSDEASVDSSIVMENDSASTKVADVNKPAQAPAVPQKDNTNMAPEEGVTVLPEVELNNHLSSIISLPKDAYSFVVFKKTDTHMVGNYITYDMKNGGYGFWLATKTGNKWQIVFNGSSEVPCNILEVFDFPKDFVDTCMDTSTGEVRSFLL